MTLTIKANFDKIESIDAILESYIENFDCKLTTMHRLYTVTAANLIAEIGDISKFSTAAKLARYSGVAPVTMTAGKNKRIVNSFFHDYYNKKTLRRQNKKASIKMCPEKAC